MKRFLVKSGIRELPLFQDEPFPFFEAYLGPDDAPEGLAAATMQPLILHMPHAVRVGGGVRPVDFIDPSETGRASMRRLRMLVDFAEARGIPYVIVHSGAFDASCRNRDSAIAALAERIGSVETANVRICMENVPCWANNCFSTEPILSEAVHLAGFKARCPQAGIVLDIDHIVLNAIFRCFYEDFKKRFAAPVGAAQRQAMEDQIHDAVTADTDRFEERVHADIDAAFTALSPDVVHAMGSDFCQYRTLGRLPLVGEALPIGYRGTVRGVPVQDRIDHDRWIRHLPENALVTLELMIRPDYDYIDQIRSSWAALVRLIPKTVPEVPVL